jgi:hypothetical protein
LSGHDEWADIPEWPHEAHEDGRVRRKPWRDADGCLHLGGEVAQCPDKRKGKGYLYVTLRDGPRRRKAHVAVLVLEAHRKPKPGPGYEACHNNNNRTDNRLCNLRWDTKEANLAQMWEERRARQADTAAAAETPDTCPGGYLPRMRRPALPVSDRVRGHAAHGTGSPPIPHLFLSQSGPVQPLPRFLRPLLSPRSRQAA